MNYRQGFKVVPHSVRRHHGHNESETDCILCAVQRAIHRDRKLEYNIYQWPANYWQNDVAISPAFRNACYLSVVLLHIKYHSLSGTNMLL